MKSIFKKIAFVLALAMVVTMMPARNASAASSDEPQMYTTLKLYVGGDVTGTYEGQRYAKVWNKGDYSVEFTSDNEEVATVSAKKGLVTAISVGKATITATFTSEDGDQITKTCAVEVKKNAVKAGLSTKSTAKVTEEGIAAGEEYQLVAVRKDADGTTVTSGRDQITDGVRFESSDPEIFTVGKTKGKITGVSEGTAKLFVWAVQSEGKDPETGEYPATTEKKEYTVKVTAGMKAQQTAHNAFQISFDKEATAKAAVDETSKYFTSASAAVTEKEDIVKVYEVLKNTAKEKIGEHAVTIGNLSQRGNAKNIVDVTMFDELKQETDYIVRYKDKEVTFTTAKNVAVELTVSAGKSVDLGGDSSRTDIVLNIFTIGTNGQKVDITKCVDYNGWEAGVVVEEITNEQYHPEYSVSTNPLDSYINFYTKDQKVVVNIKATFQDYFNKEKPGNKLENTARITAGNHAFASGSIVAWGVHNEDVNRWTWDAFNTKEFAADDLGKKLIVKAEIYYGNEKKEYVNDSDSGFTFKSSNEDKLVVDEYTGNIFPAKEPKDEIVNVYVYFDGMYIGVCPVKVWAKRQLTGFTASVSAPQVSYNSTGNFTDKIRLTMKPVDQLGNSFTRDMEVTCEVYGNDTMKSYVKLGGSSNNGIVNVTTLDNGAFVIDIEGTANLPANQSRSIRVLCTATYNDGLTKKTLTASAAFSAKNTNGSVVTNYKLELPTDLDMVLNNKNWEKGTYADKAAKIEAYSVDREGFKVARLDIEPKYDSNITDGDKGKNLVMIQQGNEYVQNANFTSSTTNELTLRTVTKKDVYVVSGSAIDNENIGRTISVTGTAIGQRELLSKMKAGSYQVSLYVAKDAGSKPTYKTGTVIRIKDSQPAVNWKWKNYSVDASVRTVGDILAAIRQAFEFNKLDDAENNKDNITGNIYVGYVQLDAQGNPTIHDVKDSQGNVVGTANTVVLSDDIVVQGSSVVVRQVRYIVTYKEGGTTYYYETLIPINKSIWVGVTQ